MSAAISIRRATLATLVALFAVTIAAAPSPARAAGGEPPWRSAETIRTALFEARTGLALDGSSEVRFVRRAEAALRGELERGLRADAPARLRELRAALDDASAAVQRGDATALGSAYGTALGALRTGAFDVATALAGRGDAAGARRWLLIRDFRKATRYTRPGVDATTALDGLEAGELSPADAVTQMRKDLLDAYQSRLLTLLDDALSEGERGYEPAIAESTALAAGYWTLLAPEYEEQRGAAARAEADRAFLRLAKTTSNPAAVAAAVEDARRLIDHFTAAPFTAEEQARRAQQLIRFLELIPYEYNKGVSGTEVTTEFEIVEAVAFSDAATSALGDLSPVLDERDPEALAELEGTIETLDTQLEDALEGAAVVPLEEIEAGEARAQELVESSFPEEWLESTDEADFDLVEISLDQMEAAVNAGEPQTAEQARLTAYAFFEFGPEIKLRAFDPGLALEVEGLMWYGAKGEDGLAQLIADESGSREIHETRLVLDESLEAARAKTGEGGSATTVITNSALIVFREGLEAVLIIAAIVASMVGTKRHLRRPILRGAMLAVPASIALFFGAVLLLDSLSQYGEKLEAIVGLVAIGVLLLVLNWFFHRVYWTEWIKGHRQRSKELIAEGAGAAVGATGTVLGLYTLGFTSVFREGFETVLFLQALQLSSGTGIVLAGVSLGLLLTAAVGAATFALERKLPYKRLLIVTGVLISLVLVVLVGNTVRTLQGVGWVSIHPIDVELPLWMGTWLGVFPTVESMVAQAGAFAFVVGSYYAAEWVRKRHVRRAVANLEAAAESAPDLPEAVHVNGDGKGNGRVERPAEPAARR